jgi:hypothetical protein
MPDNRPNQWTITGDAMIRKKALLIIFFLLLFVFQQVQARGSMPSAKKSQLQSGKPNGFTQRRFEIKNRAGFPNSTLPFGRTISHGDSSSIGGEKRLKS